MPATTLTTSGYAPCFARAYRDEQIRASRRRRASTGSGLPTVFARWIDVT
jgi:hypothetical protein